MVDRMWILSSSCSLTREANSDMRSADIWMTGEGADPRPRVRDRGAPTAVMRAIGVSRGQGTQDRCRRRCRRRRRRHQQQLKEAHHDRSITPNQTMQQRY